MADLEDLLVLGSVLMVGLKGEVELFSMTVMEAAARDARHQCFCASAA